jgi:hypothetical protein
MRPLSSHLTTASCSLSCSTVPNSPVGFPKLPKPSTRSPGVNSLPAAQGSERCGLLARSASGIARACDRGGWGGQLGIGSLVPCVISILCHEAGAVFFATLSSPQSIQHSLSKNGSAGPNCTGLTNIWINAVAKRFGRTHPVTIPASRGSQYRHFVGSAGGNENRADFRIK